MTRWQFQLSTLSRARRAGARLINDNRHSSGAQAHEVANTAQTIHFGAQISS